MSPESAHASSIVPADIELSPDGPPQELMPGLFGIRLTLPFVLDHVNIWLIADDDGWTVIDTGLGDDRTRGYWSAELREGRLAGEKVRRLLATHFHPDHMGLAGWLTELTDAEFCTSRTEWLFARFLSQDESRGFVEAGRGFDRRSGLSETQVNARAARGNLYRTRAGAPPAHYHRLQHGDRFRLGGSLWNVLVGRGHAPEMLCLHCPERNVLIAADQVLPRISPNVSVWATEPTANPLAEFLMSLKEFRELPEDCLVLPSHGQPFRGLHGRIDALIGHHDERLERTLQVCQHPRTAAEAMTALFERELDAHQLSFALGETVAHLNYLIAQDRLGHELDAGGRNRYRLL